MEVLAIECNLSFPMGLSFLVLARGDFNTKLEGKGVFRPIHTHIKTFKTVEKWLNQYTL